MPHTTQRVPADGVRREPSLALRVRWWNIGDAGAETASADIDAAPAAPFTRSVKGRCTGRQGSDVACERKNHLGHPHAAPQAPPRADQRAPLAARFYPSAARSRRSSGHTSPAPQEARRSCQSQRRRREDHMPTPRPAVNRAWTARALDRLGGSALLLLLRPSGKLQCAESLELSGVHYCFLLHRDILC